MLASVEEKRKEVIAKLGSKLKRKLRILAIKPNDGGCGYYRCILPFRKLGTVCNELVEVIIMQNPLGADKEKKRFIPDWDFYEMKWADVVMISNINNYGGHYTVDIIRKAHELGKFIHFDTDDLLTDLYKEHRLYQVYQDQKLSELTKVLYNNSHLVTVTQAKFAEQIKPFIRGVLGITRNAIDFSLPAWNHPKSIDKKVRIGWAGGIHHRPDVKVFAGVPALVNQRVGQENVIWDFYGHPPPGQPESENWQIEAWEEYKQSLLLGMKGKPNYRIHNALPPEEYGVFYANMDIAIAPLANNVFNQCKCFGKGEQVLLYDGNTKKVEDVTIGDNLMGPDSKPREVLHLSRGVGPLYKIIPTKGKPFVVTGNHILSLKTNDAATLKSRPQYVNISVSNWLTKNKSFKYNYRLYKPEQINFDRVRVSKLPLESYFVGIMLGDGSLDRTPTITTMDSEIVDYFSAYCKSFDPRIEIKIDSKLNNKAASYYASKGRFGSRENPISEILKSIGIYGCIGEEKFIPHQYKTASEEDRLNLVAGLLDTDGCLDKNKTGFTFSNKSKQLVEDLQFVCRSLGLYVSEVKEFTVPSICDTTYYKIGISGDTDKIPCKLPRKKAKSRSCNRDPLTSGFTVEYLGEGEFFGFKVTGDSLHLLHDFFVTHNSEIKLAECSAYAVPLVASNIGCYSDVIKNGKNGYLLPVDAKASDWVNVLSKFIKDKQYRESNGQELAKYKPFYDINYVVWDRLNLYCEVFNRIGWEFK